MKNGDCELQTIAADLGVRKIRYQGSKSFAGKDTSTKSLVKDHSKCILCRRCETVCNDIQTVGALSGVNRGFNTLVSTFLTLIWLKQSVHSVVNVYLSVQLEH